MACDGSKCRYQQAENKRGSVGSLNYLDVALVETWAWAYIVYPERGARIWASWSTCKIECRGPRSLNIHQTVT